MTTMMTFFWSSWASSWVVSLFLVRWGRRVVSEESGVDDDHDSSWSFDVPDDNSSLDGAFAG